MIVYGASGHGKVIIDILHQNDVHDIRLWDDGEVSQLGSFPVSKPDASLLSGNAVIISIGSNETRKKIAERLNANFHTAIHPKAVVGEDVTIDAGTVVMSGVSINPGTTIGKHAIINTNAVVDHDCRIGDYVHISPTATLCGDVWVGEGTHIGAAAVVIPGKRIGKWCTIGAGAVIISDIPDGATVVGNPGRVIKTKQFQGNEI